MTPNQLPPLPDGVTLDDLLIPLRVALETCHDSDWSLRQFKTSISHALAAIAQQAQPVAAALGDIVALWDKYAPSEYMTATHMQAKRALAGQQPVSPDMHRWCAYVGGMVACWITSEPDAHARLGDDKFDAAIAGIIERRLWAMPKRDTTPPAPQPAPVDERAEFEQWAEANVAQHHDKSDRHCMWWGWQARAELQSPAPQTKGQP